ncbi:MAG: SLC13 family permease [Prolixibacteraceae bacterium]|jgi:GntP family gluconate:H+ symporter|nr:SLC13 family permease [Prolixibacteraceae bacterium]
MNITMPAFVTDPFFILFVAVLVMVAGIIWFRLHAFIALLLAAFIVALMTPASSIEQFALASGMSAAEAVALAEKSIGERVAGAFGNTSAQIGILIAMAAVIGKCLLESGGAERIVRSVIRVTGISKAPFAFTVSSFFLAIPVFFDTVFYLMVPLAKALAARLKKNYLLLILSIAAGGTMAHSLLPPTPGPLFLVAVMDIPIHMMMTGGFIVGIFAVTSGYIYAVWIDKKLSIPLRDSPDARVSQIEALSKTESDNLPPLWFSSLPILLPVLFISMNGITEAFMGDASDGSVIYYVRGVISFIGDKNIALVIGALVALLLLSRQKSGDPGLISSSVQNALMSGGVIILITAAGGAFGGMLQQTGISLKIAELTREYQMALIPLAFIITAVVRTAQGSATVSMITAAGILSGMSGNGGLDYHVLYLGLAIACGSKPFPWMNDSGFWIISRMSNFTPGETLKSFSSMLAVMGVTGLIITYIGALVFPMV